MSKPMAAALNLDLTMAIVNGNSPVGLQPNAINMKAPTNAAFKQAQGLSRGLASPPNASQYASSLSMMASSQETKHRAASQSEVKQHSTM